MQFFVLFVPVVFYPTSLGTAAQGCSLYPPAQYPSSPPPPPGQTYGVPDAAGLRRCAIAAWCLRSPLRRTLRSPDCTATVSDDPCS